MDRGKLLRVARFHRVGSTSERNFSGMIKHLFNSKTITTASAETVVIGIKLIDAEGHWLRTGGLVLALVSAVILTISWASHSANERPAQATAAPARKHNRRNRVRVSRAD